MIQVGDKEIGAIYYVDEQGIEKEVAEVWLGDQKVWPEESDDSTPYIHLVGSFISSATSTQRYVYVNGTKYNLNKDFDFTLEDVVWEYATTNDVNYFAQYLEKITVSIRGITSLAYFFLRQTNLKEVNLSDLHTENVTDMASMFYMCRELTALDLNNLDTSNVLNMSSLFENCYNLNSLKIDKWNVGNVQDFSRMFRYAGNPENKIDELDLTQWDFGSATTLESMFSGAGIKSIIINYPDFESVENVGKMFGSEYIESVELIGWAFPNLLNSSAFNLFSGSDRLVQANLKEWNVSNISTFKGLFLNCSAMTDLNIKDWDFNSNETNMTGTSGAFSGCSSLTNVTGPIYNVKLNTSLADSPLLTSESAMVFINGLADGVSKKTLTFSSTTYNSLTPEQIAVGTAKGWTIASA